ncbi:MAG: hypothetical protein ACLTOO_05895 [Oscillospiraceae bacterium]
MTELAEAVLAYLKQENEKGKHSFTSTDLTTVGKISFDRADKIIQELADNGYVQVNNNIARTFNLI